MVKDPMTMGPNQTVQEAINLMYQKKISGIPVVDGAKLLGIVTNRDIQFEKNMHEKLSKIMTKKLVTAKEGISLSAAKDLLHTHRIEKLLIVNNKNELKGLI